MIHPNHLDSSNSAERVRFVALQCHLHLLCHLHVSCTHSLPQALPQSAHQRDLNRALWGFATGVWPSALQRQRPAWRPRDDPADITAEAALLEAFSEIPTVAGAWVHPAGPGTSALTVCSWCIGADRPDRLSQAASQHARFSLIRMKIDVLPCPRQKVQSNQRKHRRECTAQVPDALQPARQLRW